MILRSGNPTLKADTFAVPRARREAAVTSSRSVRDIICEDQDRLHLRGLLLHGAASAPSGPADAAYFGSLRDGVRNQELRRPRGRA